LMSSAWKPQFSSLIGCRLVFSPRKEEEGNIPRGKANGP